MHPITIQEKTHVLSLKQALSWVTLTSTIYLLFNSVLWRLMYLSESPSGINQYMENNNWKKHQSSFFPPDRKVSIANLLGHFRNASLFISVLDIVTCTYTSELNKKGLISIPFFFFLLLHRQLNTNFGAGWVS